MQNTIEKGMKIHPAGTLLAVLACMLIFYVCNLVLMKFSRKPLEDDLMKETKQRVEEVKGAGHAASENETSNQGGKVEDLKATERDIDRAKKEIKARAGVEAKQIPVLVKT